jgi:hypothetical protein
MAAFDRGFKSWAERTSINIRRELGLAAHETLDPLELAKFLDIEVCTPHDIPGLPHDVLDQLLEQDPWGWSGVSLSRPGARDLIIYNPRKSKGRRASDIAHELAHFILDHQPGALIFSSDGDIAMRTFDGKQEEEANWLAWCLLLPREALVKAKRVGLTVAHIADRYGVTERLVSYRLSVTGVDLQVVRRSRS